MSLSLNASKQVDNYNVIISLGTQAQIHLEILLNNNKYNNIIYIYNNIIIIIIHNPNYIIQLLISNLKCL